MGETYVTSNDVMARGVLPMQLNGCVILMTWQNEDVVIAEDMLGMGGESNADGNDDEDAVVVSFVNAVVSLTCCGSGFVVPVLE